MSAQVNWTETTGLCWFRWKNNPETIYALAFIENMTLNEHERPCSQFFVFTRCIPVWSWLYFFWENWPHQTADVLVLLSPEFAKGFEADSYLFPFRKSSHIIFVGNLEISMNPVRESYLLGDGLLNVILALGCRRLFEQGQAPRLHHPSLFSDKDYERLWQ